VRRGAVIVSIGFAALAAVVGAVLFVSLGSGGSSGRAASPPLADPADTAHPTPPPSGRLVVLSRTMPPPSTGARLNAQLVSGSVPASGSNRVLPSVERPMLSRPPDSPSGATRLRDCPALQVSYLSTPGRGAGQSTPP
jgi:hypothetical protein